MKKSVASVRKAGKSNSFSLWILPGAVIDHSPSSFVNTHQSQKTKNRMNVESGFFYKKSIAEKLFVI